MFQPCERSALRPHAAASTVVFLFLLGLIVPPFALAQTKPIKRVLVINELGIASPLTSFVDGVILEGLQKTPYQIELYSEFMETTLFPAPATQKEFERSYVHKYQDRRPDVIVAVGPSPLNFLAANHDKFFPGIPVVFCVSTKEMANNPKLGLDFTGVWESIDLAKTMAAAMKLQPNAKHAVIVGGTAAYDKYIETSEKDVLRGYERRLNVTYLTDLDMPTLLDRLKHLPTDTVILYAGVSEDAAGAHYIEVTQSTPMIAHAANAPVYSTGELEVGKGVIGGNVVSYSKEGEIVAADVLRVLNGEKPRDIPVVTGANVYMFDWRALQRWGLKERDLPLGSVVLNRSPSMWEAYWRYAIAGLVLLVAQGVAIAALLWQRTRRKRAELNLRDSNLQLSKSEEKFSKAFHRSPLAITLTKAQDGRYLDVNETFEETTGWNRKEIIGRTPFDLGIWPAAGHGIHLEHQALSNGVQNVEFSFRTRAGEIRTGLGSVEPLEIGGERCVLSVATDITERKRAHEEIQRALREGEERFRLVANTAPVMIWMAGLDRRGTYFNQRWLEFRGRSLESELKDDWLHDIHSEDKRRCIDVAAQAFEQRKSFTIEYRLRRYDGEYRWVLDTGIPRFDSDGSLAGFIGSVVDVTDLKRAEKALSSLSGRLIEAQEQERRYIARELHDDISQQLALLSVELQCLAPKLPESDAGLRDELKVILNGTMEVASNVHTLSHRLHTSKLEMLGLVATMRSFCRELSEQRKVEIDFRHGDVPDDLPQQMSLCLFRVLQEGLNNAVKYSGVRKFQVRLERVSDKLQLRIRDEGIGFDPGMEMFTTGLGLMSMRERVSLVKGVLAIESKPRCGTEIRISVPIPAHMEMKRSSASGR